MPRARVRLPLKRAWNASLFFVIAALPAGSSLLLTLVLVRGLGIAGFATWSIIEPLLLILSGTATLGTHFSVLYLSARDEVDPRRVLGAAFVVAAPVSLVLGLIAGQFGRLSDASLSPTAFLLPLLGDTLAQQLVASLRGMRRLNVWAAFEVVRSFGLVLTAFAAIRWAPAYVSTVNDFLLLRGLLTMTGVLLAALVLRAPPVADRGLILRMVRYGLPSSGSSLLGLVINSADRFLLAALGLRAEVIASYAAHQRLTGLLGVLTVSPLQLWFPVEAIRRDTGTQAAFFQGVLAAVTAGLVAVMLGAFVAGPLLWPWLFSSIDFEPLLYVLLTLAIVPRALGIVVNIGGLREKQTHWNLIAVAITGAAMALLGVPLILWLAGIGAALARLLALSIQAVSLAEISRRIAPVAYRLRVLVPFVAAAMLASFIPFSPTTAPGIAAALTAAALVLSGLALNRRLVLALIGGRDPD